MTKISETRIMVFGTFDILHKGHLNFFKQARALSPRPYLIVSVARDVNVKKIKGRPGLFSEKIRFRNLKKIKGIKRVVMGGKGDYISHIIKEKPDIIALGYDQRAYTKNLKKTLKNKGLKVKIYRLKAYFPKKFKSSVFRKKVL